MIEDTFFRPSSMALTPLSCVDKEGSTLIFYYEFDRPLGVEHDWHFRVHLRNPAQVAEDDFFEMTLSPLGTDSVFVTLISNRKMPWYSAKGIPDALIPEAARVLGKSIASSQSARRSKERSEYRTEDVEKMWKRLTTNGLARYDPREDRYVHPRDAVLKSST